MRSWGDLSEDRCGLPGTGPQRCRSSPIPCGAGRAPGRVRHGEGAPDHTARRPPRPSSAPRSSLPLGPHPGPGAPRVSAAAASSSPAAAAGSARTWEGRRGARIRAADASGWGAPGSAAAASPGLRGSGGQSRHPHRLPQEVGPPTSHPQPAGRAGPAPPRGPAPGGTGPLSGARLRSAAPEHHREGRAPPVQRGLRARARPLAEPSCRSPSRARRGSPGVRASALHRRR